MYPSGNVLVQFTNGDTKKTVACVEQQGLFAVSAPGQTVTKDSPVVVYYYAEARTTHTTYPSGEQVYAFQNGQVRAVCV